MRCCSCFGGRRPLASTGSPMSGHRRSPAALKLGYWRFIDTHARAPARQKAPRASARSARCGCSRRRTPSENYLLKEMGFQIARKHAAKLRRIALLLAFALPFLLSLAPLLAAGWPATLAAAHRRAARDAGRAGRTLALLRRGQARRDALLRHRPGVVPSWAAHCGTVIASPSSSARNPRSSKSATPRPSGPASRWSTCRVAAMSGAISRR